VQDPLYQLTCTDCFKFHPFCEAFVISTCGAPFSLKFVYNTATLFNALIILFILNRSLWRFHKILWNGLGMGLSGMSRHHRLPWSSRRELPSEFLKTILEETFTRFACQNPIMIARDSISTNWTTFIKFILCCSSIFRFRIIGRTQLTRGFRHRKDWCIWILMAWGCLERLIISLEQKFRNSKIQQKIFIKSRIYIFFSRTLNTWNFRLNGIRTQRWFWQNWFDWIRRIDLNFR